MFSLELIRTILLLCQTDYTVPSSIRQCVKEYIACTSEPPATDTSKKLLFCYLNKKKD